MVERRRLATNTERCAATARRGARFLSAAPRSATRAGGATLLGAAAVVLLALATGGGVWWWSQNGKSADDSQVLLHTVGRGDFELSVTERGEIESFDVTEVRSMVKSNNTAGTAILRIVPEGTEVEPGDFLVELDSSALRAQRTSQRILANTAQAAEVEAHNLYDTAVISKREYLEGLNIQERQLIESEVFVAEENLNRAKEYYAYSQKLASKGYVNELQLEADRFAVEKANKDLDAAKTKLRVLEEFTKPKMLSTLESAILIAKAKWEAAQNSHELEIEKLGELEDQIAKCTIVAPQAGVVKYAHGNDRRGDQEFIVEEGALIRERQTIILLPNASSMQVKLTVNESLIQYVRPGLPASISPVGMGDKVLRGTVRQVNQYAEPTGWRQANVKDYRAFISVDEPLPELRSGMTAAVTVQCALVRNAMQVPVQTIYAHGDKFYCFAYEGGRWEAREVVPGPTNNKFFVVEGGLQEGERIALNPRRYVDYVDLPKLSPEEAQRAVPQGPTGLEEQDPSIEVDSESLPAGRPPGPPNPDYGPSRQQTEADGPSATETAAGGATAPAGLAGNAALPASSGGSGSGEAE